MPRAGVLRARRAAGWAGRGPAQLRVSGSGLFMILDDPTAELSAISPVRTPAVGRLNSSDHGLPPRMRVPLITLATRPPPVTLGLPAPVLIALSGHARTTITMIQTVSPQNSAVKRP